MDILDNLMLGAQTAFTPEALLFCFSGVFIGTFVGALPGIGPMVAISVVLPLTFGLEPAVALIMLAGIFYGAQYGGSVTAILLNLPGTPSTAVTALDGYPMSQGGRAGLALFINAVASFLGGSFAILLVMGFAPSIARFALNFNSTEYFSVMLLGLVAASTLSNGSTIKSLVMVVLGLALGLVGMDPNSGVPRFTFGIIDFYDGISLIAIAMGLFGVAEIINKMTQPGSIAAQPVAHKVPLREMVPSRGELRTLFSPTLRGASLGSIIGTLPGAGPSIASFMAYAVEKKVSKNPSKFGKGAIEGVAAPESANNASVQAAFIPTLSLGIPGDVVMAILLGAMMMHGVTPGPQFITNEPAMFWGLIVSFWIGNLLLLVLNIPMIGIFIKIMKVPARILYPTVIFFICLGSYSVSNSVFNIFLTLFFGVLGYVLLRFRFHPAPVLLGFILGPMMEENLRRSLVISRGDITVFLDRPVSVVLLGITFLLLMMPLIKIIVRKVVGFGNVVHKS
ncbi:tripartite tricarboxylate transporter permease [Halomonas sp. MCCC 1A11036]|uniref:Tripartite tricarboxylate transporter permease n=1 Tax=Billgrantia zhangzhouensis TaxID=2733481 RepID=A0ABS9AFL9_9GAMM|nr:tripartite tricarboxylate transporter permease [Halomonas zhangzhouensis]MCE8020506.1 tripartite tricarboxylate transporter permease [Halomonas zhangzhouensis]